MKTNTADVDSQIEPTTVQLAHFCLLALQQGLQQILLCHIEP